MSDADLVIAVTGKIYVSPVDTTAPADTLVALGAPASPWIYAGAASSDTLPEWGSDGGDTNPVGHWANPSARSLTTAASETLTFSLVEWNNQALSLYYGTPLTGDGATVGSFGVSSVRTKEYALLVVMNDMNGGEHLVAYYAARASIGRGDSVQVAVDAFGALQLQANILHSEDEDAQLFEWIVAGGSAALGPAA